jgi:Zn-finger nucleic acid-binding protein
MKCPVCETTLREIEKYGVEIDICPGCKGVWLDRGELEKVIELEAAGGPSPAPAPSESHLREPQPREESRRRDDDDDDDRRPRYDKHGRPVKKKRESWFGEIFELFGD